MDDTTDTNGAYAGYIEKKGWHHLFQHTEAEAGLFAHELREPLADAALQRLVDVGFGSGSLLSWGRSRGLQVSGVEVQTALLEAGRAAGFAVFSDMRAFADQSVDLVTGMDVVEHMTAEQLDGALVEWRRMLRPGGWLVLRTPNCQSPAGLIDQFGDGTHRQMLSGPILSDVLRRAGFQVCAVRGAKNCAEFEPKVSARLRTVAKRALRIPARAVIRLGLGLGAAILEPSVIVIARNSK